MTNGSSRRTFMKQTAALGAAWWVANNVARGEDSKNPLEQLRFGCIGVDGKGSSDSDDAGKNGVIAALCDIDSNRLNKKGAKFPDAAKFFDYREMLDTMGDKIDAVTVSTPDHSHAPASILAMKHGKHVFCQKPLTWSVIEARGLRNAARHYRIASQMGNQGTSETKLREAVEIVRSGAIGDVTEVHIWTNRPIWPQGTGRPTDTAEPPPNLHWDLFLGPAAERPYSPAYHPFAWRGFVDFGTGALGDMACHTMNMPCMALELFEPTSVEAESPGVFENESFPKFSQITYQFPARSGMPACKMVWYDGGKKPPESLMKGEGALPGTGSILVGSKGTLVSYGDYGGQRNQLLPTKDFEKFEMPKPFLPRSIGHFAEFAAACRGGFPAMSNFEHAARLTETLLLGNVAMRAGKKIEWDATNLKVTNIPEANKYLHREYRKGWTELGEEIAKFAKG
ncbi:MAG: Gfo/Idh/MocA family oxidoreductase [Planctomycetaceae bacterium]|nr:Gfo/Idh/MocA family oxidoreductase [Planctomycetaceae bacterium]